MIRSKAPSELSREMYDADDEALLRAESNEPDTADYGLITRYLAGELSAEDRKLVEERLRTDQAFRLLAEPLMMIWKVPYLLDGKADPVVAERAVENFNKRFELHQLGIHTPTLEEKRRTRGRRRGFIRGVIISAIMGFMGWLGVSLRPQWIPQPSLYVHVDAPLTDGERSLLLPDEAEMTLAPGSHVTYSRWFLDSTERTVHLDGIATFVIAPGPRRVLVVDGAGVEVRSSEGRFRVTAYNAVPIATVEVYEGRVDVRPHTVFGRGDIYRLHAGQSVQVGPGFRIERDDHPIAPHVDRQTGNRERGTTVTQRPVAPPTPTPALTLTPKRTVAPRTQFVNWPPDMAPRAQALADAIERDFGEPPRSITFAGRDTIRLEFWNPYFWQNDMQSNELPQESLPLVRKASLHLGGFVWNNFGRDAGINWMHFVFMRVRKDKSYLDPTRIVPAQDVNVVFTRENFERGLPEQPMLGIVNR